jgi:OOP family OmpA-OmpF porin
MPVSYVVFFGAKSSAISVEAQGVLKQAADNVASAAAAGATYRKAMIDYDTMITFNGKTPPLPPEVDQAVAAHTAKVSVVGYSDTTGTRAAALHLSRKRAQAAAADLVKLGVPRAAIRVSGKGKADPTVPTANGVREPQNNRVTVDVTY